MDAHPQHISGSALLHQSRIPYYENATIRFFSVSTYNIYLYVYIVAYNKVCVYRNAESLIFQLIDELWRIVEGFNAIVKNGYKLHVPKHSRQKCIHTASH